jgi:hypothetical protein
VVELLRLGSAFQLSPPIPYLTFEFAGAGDDAGKIGGVEIVGWTFLSAGAGDFPVASSKKPSATD